MQQQNYRGTNDLVLVVLRQNITSFYIHVEIAVANGYVMVNDGVRSPELRRR